MKKILLGIAGCIFAVGCAAGVESGGSRKTNVLDPYAQRLILEHDNPPVPIFYLMFFWNYAKASPHWQDKLLAAFRAEGILAFIGEIQWDKPNVRPKGLSKLSHARDSGTSVFVGPLESEYAARQLIQRLPSILSSLIARHKESAELLDSGVSAGKVMAYKLAKFEIHLLDVYPPPPL